MTPTWFFKTGGKQVHVLTCVSTVHWVRYTKLSLVRTKPVWVQDTVSTSISTATMEATRYILPFSEMLHSLFKNKNPVWYFLCKSCCPNCFTIKLPLWACEQTDCGSVRNIWEEKINEWNKECEERRWMHLTDRFTSESALWEMLFPKFKNHSFRNCTVFFMSV